MAAERLVTWNLFFSASAYERHEPISHDVLEDLSNLVDLLCLYDNLRVLGDPKLPPFRTHRTPFFAALRESKAVLVRLPRAETRDNLVLAMLRHLQVLLPLVPRATLESWIPHALKMNEVPTAREELAHMNASIRLDPPHALSTATAQYLGEALSAPDDPHGLRPFVARTMMYFAYAEIENVVFAPDAMRRRILETAVESERDLVSQLRSAFREQWEKHPALGARDLRRRVSPFAAVVLERCMGDRTAIPGELVRLRQQLAPDRSRIAEIEQDILLGSRSDAVRAERRWSGVLSEITRAYGPSPELVSLTQGLTVASEAGKVFDEPKKAAAWIKALAALPVEVVVRLLDRRPAAQIHKLRAELPGPERLLKAVRFLSR